MNLEKNFEEYMKSWTIAGTLSKMFLSDGNSNAQPAMNSNPAAAINNPMNSSPHTYQEYIRSFQGTTRAEEYKVMTLEEWHDQMGIPMPKKAETYDDGKPPLANLPSAGIREVAMVQAYGHKKYKDFNNYRKGMEASRQASCAMRHIMDFMDGQDVDSESGRSHLAHAACRLLFMLQNINDGVLIDDRFKKSQ